MLLKPSCFLLVLPLLLTKTEITGKAAQAPPAIRPDATELKKDGGTGRAFRVRQQAFELIEPLLRAKNCSFLLPQLVNHPLPLTLELGKLPFQLGAIPEQAQELVVIDRLSANEQLPDKG